MARPINGIETSVGNATYWRFLCQTWLPRSNELSGKRAHIYGKHTTEVTPMRTLFLAAVLATAAVQAMGQDPAGTTPPSPAQRQAPAGTQQPPTPAQQQPNGTYTIQRNTRLVILDAVVVDGKGNPIPDLRKEDFSVTEMGEPQQVLNFEHAGASVPAASLTINSTAELDKMAPRAPVNIIVLDEFNTRFEDMAFARYSLKKFLEMQPDKLEIPTMLLAVDLQNLNVVKDYTQDKQALIQALDKHFVAYPWQTHQFAWISERYATAFITLRRVAQATTGHFGHKNMIWVGRGFPPFNFANAAVDQQRRVDNALQDAVNTLRDARITLYTIDPAGVMIDPGKYGNAAAFNDPMGGNYQFAALAKSTGGAALYGRNDVDTEIGTAIKDGASFYTLTYRPTDTSRDMQKFRKIVVTVNRPGTKVLTREGYFLAYGPGRVDPTNPSRRLMTDLVAAESSKMVYDGVPVTLEKDTTAPDTFLLHVEPRNVPWSYATDTEPRRVELILMCTQFDKKGKEIDRDARSMKISAGADAPPTGPLLKQLNLRYHMKHNDKAVRARFTLRMTATGRIGTADTDLNN